LPGVPSGSRILSFQFVGWTRCLRESNLGQSRVFDDQAASRPAQNRSCGGQRAVEFEYNARRKENRLDRGNRFGFARFGVFCANRFAP
jgi:hypothetical protein